MPNNYTTIAICSPGYDFDCDEFNRKHEKTCLCSVVKPMPERVGGEKTDWYQWAIDNWGTKWGTYQMKAFPLDGDSSPVVIKFQSAWCTPKILPEIAAWLKKVGKFDKVKFIGFEPYDDSVKLLETN